LEDGADAAAAADRASARIMSLKLRSFMTVSRTRRAPRTHARLRQLTDRRPIDVHHLDYR
jgi:ribosomal protein L31E